MVSHDLRAPLMSIQIIIELLSAGRFGEINQDGKARLSLAEEEVDRLMRMIKDLLDLERLESGAGNLDLQATPID
ncbi:histidine kinase dimerization/phospho-acceptor domain-containing protein, partial [Acinetobacter baumannii]